MSEAAPDATYDVLVVGATPAGCAAALAAARAGCTVALTEPLQVLGGMTSNGVGIADTGSFEALSGIFLEFIERVRAHYLGQEPRDPLYESAHAATAYWEPKVAARTWQLMLDHPRIDVHLGAVAVDSTSTGRRIEHVVFERTTHPMGDLAEKAERFELSARVVVDATYEGDVAAWAGVPFRLGREERTALEPHAGHIYTEYMSREPRHGYPPDTILPGSTGAADGRIMAFNYRVVCTSDPTGSGPLPPEPSEYHPERYRWSRKPAEDPNGLTQGGVACPGGKIYLNVVHCGNDLVGPNREYVLAHPRARSSLRQPFVDQALGFLKFIRESDGAPRLALAADEFADNGHLPYQIYPREGRRIEGLTTLSESDVNPFLRGHSGRPPLRADSVAIGDFEMDSKACRDDPECGDQPSEGAFFLRQVRAPFQVPFGAIVPRDIDNLLVPCAISATHVAYSAVRMEPVWTVLGQAAGTAAAMAIQADAPPAKLSTTDLQNRLIDQGCALTYFRDVSPSHPDFRDVQRLALAGFVPARTDLAFKPEAPATMGDLAEAIVRMCAIPLSVTGIHFEELRPDHRAFPFVETLFDLGTCTGIEIFPGTDRRRYDAFEEFHRAHVRQQWLQLDPDDTPTAAVVSRVVAHVCAALSAGERMRGPARSRASDAHGHDSQDPAWWLARSDCESESLVPRARLCSMATLLRNLIDDNPIASPALGSSGVGILPQPNASRKGRP